ncbi:hypothetical protein NF552_26380 (plasmid) [Roseomonas mucosa]|nr:hypothetical protein NF552_26380 [Roseomonas mucosa]
MTFISKCNQDAFFSKAGQSFLAFGRQHPPDLGGGPSWPPYGVRTPRASRGLRHPRPQPQARRRHFLGSLSRHHVVFLVTGKPSQASVRLNCSSSSLRFLAMRSSGVSLGGMTQVGTLGSGRALSGTSAKLCLGDSLVTWLDANDGEFPTWGVRIAGVSISFGGCFAFGEQRLDLRIVGFAAACCSTSRHTRSQICIRETTLSFWPFFPSTPAA